MADHAGADRTRFDTALDRLRALVTPHERTDRLPIAGADGRTLHEAIPARRDAPSPPRADRGDAGPESGELLADAGQQLRPSDIGRLKAAGVDEVEVAGRPTVGVVPTGDDLVQATGGPPETVETNGLTVAQLVTRWGGHPTYRRPITADPEALRAAIQRDLTKDLVVTTEVPSTGASPRVPDVLHRLGEVVAEGIAIDPGRSMVLGRVEATPVIVLPADPIASLVGAVQFGRPAVKWAGSMPRPPHPRRAVSLREPIESPPGVRTFAGVAIRETEEDVTASPIPSERDGAAPIPAGIDGWVEVAESTEGVPAGAEIAAQIWEPSS